jgi:hypothetical protein
MIHMLAPSKWSCKACGCPIPYNPDYDMSNVFCSHCAAYYNSDRLLGGYRWVAKPKVKVEVEKPINKTLNTKIKNEPKDRR